jgi:hypothetical protein
MSIVVLSATSDLNCFGTKAGQMKMPLALAVTVALSEYSPLSPLFLKGVKGHLPRLGEVPPVAHVLPQVVPAATCNSPDRNCQKPQSQGKLNSRAMKTDARRLVTVVGLT